MDPLKIHDPNERRDFLTALDFAYRAHRGQFRKGSGLPFIVHPLAVLSQLSEWGVTNIVVWKAGVCHDVREDCPKVAHDHLVKVIGIEAADIVEELSFFPDKGQPISYPDQKAAYMETFGSKGIPALVIKCADRICNTFDWLSTDPEYAKVYWKKAASLLEAMRERNTQINEFFKDEALAGHMRYTAATLESMIP